MGKRITRSRRNIDWIETHCRIPDGKFVGQPVRLRPFQKKALREIYDTPTRQCILSFGRKNAKTTLSAFLLLLHLCGPEARRNSQLNSAAQSRDQAAIVFELAAKIVRMSPDMSEAVGIRDAAKELYCPELGTKYKALSAEASTAYGLSPVFVLHDELGQVVGPRSKLYDALETACGAHDNPISIVISTQAPTDGDLLSILIDDALTGRDPLRKVALWTADEALDPFSVKAIREANPAYGDFLNDKEVKGQAENARRMPAMEASYRNLVLNQRVNQESPLIPKSVWMECAGTPDRRVLEKGIVFAGLDLSKRTDLTALVYGARDEKGVIHCFAEFFAPADGVAERSAKDRVPYDLWAEQGYLTLTPGRSVAYEFVAERLIDICDSYHVQAINYDRWRVEELKDKLKERDADLPIMAHGQGFKDMSPSIDNLEVDLLNGKVRHGNNPILTWCAANTISTADPAGNRKANKAKSTGRIDGMIAMIMAFGPISSVEDTGHAYQERGFIAL